jgi:lysine N6-hydroxylase
MKATIYDVAGIGIGPFNLGFAALADSLPLNTIYFEQRPAFNWHPGMMIENTTLQVPFIADLVSAVDIRNKFSFLNYLQQHGRLYQFCIKESFHITRKEYNDYCNWAIRQLPNCNFSHRVESVRYNKEANYYEISVHDMINRQVKTYAAKKILLGVGTSPLVPGFAAACTKECIFHSSEYLRRKKYIPDHSTITIVGSGQSAAEIFYDLLQLIDIKDLKINWITDAERFFPMENSKLTFELTSPDYLNYFYDLPSGKKEEVLNRQYMLYKGINQELIDAIYDMLYLKQIHDGQAPAVSIKANCRVEDIQGNKNEGFELQLFHTEMEQRFTAHSNVVILSTGYKYEIPGFLDEISNRIQKDEKGRLAATKNFAVDRSGNEIFVSNAAIHSHGFLTPDLGMGPYRNATILNAILGEPHYKLEQRIAFQDFGVPGFKQQPAYEQEPA